MEEKIADNVLAIMILTIMDTQNAFQIAETLDGFFQDYIHLPKREGKIKFAHETLGYLFRN